MTPIGGLNLQLAAIGRTFASVGSGGTFRLESNWVKAFPIVGQRPHLLNGFPVHLKNAWGGDA